MEKRDIMKHKNSIFYGIVCLGAAAACFYGADGISFSFLGLFDIKMKTVGIVFLIFGGLQLASGIFTDGDIAELIGNIIAFPLELLAWALEHWVITLLIVGAIIVFSNSKSDNKHDNSDGPVQELYSTEVTTTPTETAWVPPVTTEPVQTVPAQPYPGMHRNVGLCKNLTRDAQLLLVFVNDSTSSWTQQEMDWFVRDLVEPALAYIEYHAGQYGYMIDLETCVYPDEAGNIKTMNYHGTISDYDSKNLATDLVVRASETYGFTTANDMVKNLQDYAGTDQIAVVFCLDKPGRSYAQWHDTIDAYVEYAVVFSSWEGTVSRAGMVAHEVMHLFGADDLYAYDGKWVNRNALTESWYPQELLHQVQWNLYDNVISPYTAYAVGWLDTMPPQFECPEWWS